MLSQPRTTAGVPAWDAPATTVSFAGVHGGAGASTLSLLVAHGVAAAGSAPTLTVDLAGRSRGGLAVLGGGAGRTTAEGTAAVAIHGGALRQPFGVNEAGVRIMGAQPNGVEELDRSHETLVARLVEAVGSGVDDARLVDLVRSAVHEDCSWQALRWDNDQVVDAIASVLDQALPHHSLIALDLGMIDSGQISSMVELRSDLHVWVVPGRPHSLEIAERRLPQLPFEPVGGEVIAVWQTEDRVPSAKRLSQLGDMRGCPVVRVANHGGAGQGWPAMVQSCQAGIDEICGLAR